MIPLLYAVVTFRRAPEYDDDHRLVNVKHDSFSSSDLEMVGGRSRPRSASLPASSPRNSTSTQADSVYEPIMAQRRGAYNHERSTHFDAYRESASLKESLDRAMGSGFGWGNARPGARNSIERNSSLVSGGGVVPSAKPAHTTAAPAALRQDATAGVPGRSTSWHSERALVPVPEGEEDEVAEGEHRRNGTDEHGVSPEGDELPETGKRNSADRGLDESSKALLGYQEVTFDFNDQVGNTARRQ